MGGSGSGPPARHAGTVEAAQAVDVLWLHRKRFLAPAGAGGVGFVTGTLSWTLDGQPLATLSYAASESKFELNGTAIPLERTTCHFGGVRPWFRCPECSRRCQTLFFTGRWRCRLCGRLTYDSRRMHRQVGAEFRAARKSVHGRDDHPSPHGRCPPAGWTWERWMTSRLRRMTNPLYVARWQRKMSRYGRAVDAFGAAVKALRAEIRNRNRRSRRRA